MQIPNYSSEDPCSRLQLYLDRELSLTDQVAFDAHIATCDNCRIEIELQREIAMFPDEIVLPRDFSRVVAANAESQVQGLRKLNERKITLAIILGLTLLVSLVVGGSVRFSTIVFFMIERFGALADVLASFAFNLLFGIVVIAKVAAAQLGLSYSAVVVFGGFVLAVVLVHLYFTGRIPVLRRAKR